MKIKNWKEFQHYKDRDPKWIKLYTKLLNDDEWFSLDPKHAKVLVMLWLLASEDPLLDGNLPTLKKVAFRLRMSESSLESTLSALSHWVEHPASNSLSTHYQPASLETEEEREIEKETEADTATASPSLVETLVDLWNLIPGVIKAKAVTGPIKKRLLARIEEHPDLVWWTTYFDRIRDSEFLTGRSKVDFAATLDWVIGPKNMAKILNGNYDGRTKAPQEESVIEKFLKRGNHDQGTVFSGVDAADGTAVGTFLQGQ